MPLAFINPPPKVKFYLLSSTSGWEAVSHHMILIALPREHSLNISHLPFISSENNFSTSKFSILDCLHKNIFSFHPFCGVIWWCLCGICVCVVSYGVFVWYLPGLCLYGVIWWVVRVGYMNMIKCRCLMLLPMNSKGHIYKQQ